MSSRMRYSRSLLRLPLTSILCALPDTVCTILDPSSDTFQSISNSLSACGAIDGVSNATARSTNDTANAFGKASSQITNL